MKLETRRIRVPFPEVRNGFRSQGREFSVQKSGPGIAVVNASKQNHVVEERVRLPFRFHTRVGCGERFEGVLTVGLQASEEDRAGPEGGFGEEEKSGGSTPAGVVLASSGEEKREQGSLAGRPCGVGFSRDLTARTGYQADDQPQEHPGRYVIVETPQRGVSTVN